MRFVANIDGQAQTERFVAYLLSKNISSHIERSDRAPEQWDVWVRDEDRFQEAKAMLDEFKSDPANPRYSAAVKEAEQIIEERRKSANEAIKRQRTLQKHSYADLATGRLPPITLTLMILSIMVSLITSLGDPKPTNTLGLLTIQELQYVANVDYNVSNQDPLASIKKGEVWRLITPMFLHLSITHIIFNLLVLSTLGRIAERLEGQFKYLIIVLLLAIISNCAQALVPERFGGNPMFGGLSGVIYGLFGYIWVKTTLRPSIGFGLSSTYVMLMIGFLILSLGGVFGDNLAHMAHLGGLCGGAVLGAITARLP